MKSFSIQVNIASKIKQDGDDDDDDKLFYSGT